MPVIKSAIKKLRQDKKREQRNDVLRELLKSTIRSAKKTSDGAVVAHAFSVVDKAAKNNIIHKNKASRIKSALSKISKPTTSKSPVKSTPKPKTKASTKKAVPAKKQSVK